MGDITLNSGLTDKVCLSKWAVAVLSCRPLFELILGGIDTNKRILVIDESLTVFRELEATMRDDNIQVIYAMSDKEIIGAFLTDKYCLVIINICFASDSSLELIHYIRQIKMIPILVLIPKFSSEEKVNLFRAGANTFLEKPFHTTVCTAQAHSLIRLYMEVRVKDRTIQPLIFGKELIIDSTHRHVIIDGEVLLLTRTEFDLLLCLAEHPGHVWSYSQLYRHVWNDELSTGNENTVRTHIGNLRKKLAQKGKTTFRIPEG